MLLSLFLTLSFPSLCLLHSVSHSCFLLLSPCFPFHSCPSFSDEPPPTPPHPPHPPHPYISAAHALVFGRLDAFSRVARTLYSSCRVREQFGLWRGHMWLPSAPNSLSLSLSHSSSLPPSLSPVNLQTQLFYLPPFKTIIHGYIFPLSICTPDWFI